ncbi:MAG: aldehyde dehydrogenase (NADP(+)) [Bacteroidota bacterium]
MITSNQIGYNTSAEGQKTIHAIDPANQAKLPGAFHVATEVEVNQAVAKAQEAWKTYRQSSPKDRARFLRQIAEEIDTLGDTLVERVMAESGLPEGRVKGERGRTCNQLRLFAQIAEEGSWVEATIDPAMPDRTPMPRVDIRKMLQAMGPVVVFTASNFPLAFSTAGGDTASALAAGCPVIVKAHPSHLGTNALISEAINKAAQKTEMPDGVFSSLNDGAYAVGTQLVKHPTVKAVAFTGSMRGGMALHKAAMDRDEPIPVFAEMGSTNPIFIMPQKIEQDASSLAQQLAGSINLGAGQFCTNPGLLLVIEDENTPEFTTSLEQAFQALVPATMLNEGIYAGFEKQKQSVLQQNEVSLLYAQDQEVGSWKGFPAVATISGKDFLANPKVHEEVFGPFTILVKAQSYVELQAIAQQMHGQLTATIIGPEDQLNNWVDLARNLEEKVGRLIYNGVPTGVEVGYAMQHGGPFPATTDSRFTSVGADAIKRFARPVAYQNCPEVLLPDALKSSNPLGISRKVNGKLEINS